MDTIIKNNFSLTILSNKPHNTDLQLPVEKIIHDNHNYFALPNNSNFILAISNNHPARADAHIWIDGEKIGIWRINPHSTVTVRRKYNYGDKFTAKKINLWRVIRQNGRHTHAYQNNGLIKIIFKLEKYRPYELYNNPTHITKIDLTKYRNIHNTFDTVTPYGANNTYYNSHPYNYLYNHRPIYGQRVQKQIIKPSYPFNSINLKKSSNKLSRFARVPELESNYETIISARIVTDSDRLAYRRDYNGLRQQVPTRLIPPIPNRQHMGRPYNRENTTPFSLSRKYYFDNY